MTILLSVVPGIGCHLGLIDGLFGVIVEIQNPSGGRGSFNEEDELFHMSTNSQMHSVITNLLTFLTHKYSATLSPGPIN